MNEVAAQDSPTPLDASDIAGSRFDVARVCLVILTALACLAALYVAAEIVLPLLLALVLSLLLAPARRLLVRLRMPDGLAALVLIAGLFAAFGGLGTAVSLPATQWIARAPQDLPKLQEKLGVLRQPINYVRNGLDQLQNLMNQELVSAGNSPEKVKVEQANSGMGGIGLTVLQGTGAALGQVLTFVVVLFFLLAAGDSLLRRLVEIAPDFGDKRRVVEIAYEIEDNISAYLMTITAMNLAVGVINGISIWAQGLPDPLLWGTVSFLLNYIPIVGPLAGMVLFFAVGVLSTSNFLWALLPTAIYLVVHVTEGQLITPMLVARRFTLNPVLVIVSLFFWAWMWGALGAVLAVPLLAICKIFCDHIEVLAPFGHLLGGDERREK